MGRPRLPTPERKLRKRESQERWKQKYYEYYTEQKRTLTNRPKYKAVRRDRYFARKAEVRRQILATHGDTERPRSRPHQTTHLLSRAISSQNPFVL